MTRQRKRSRDTSTRPRRPLLRRERPHALRDRSAWPWILAVGLSAAVVYLNAFGQQFVLDDTRLIADNVRIRSLSNLPALFASSYWDVAGAQALYRPLVLATYAVNYAAHGLSTYGYTAVNLALHAAASLLVFGLVRSIGAPLLAAGVAGLAFAVHPVHTEAVAGIAGRPELLAAVFVLLAILFHRMAPRSASSGTWARVGTCAAFALALLSKESAMTLLLVLPVVDALVPAADRTMQPATPRTRVLTDYVPLVGIALAYLAVRRAVLGAVLIDIGTIAPLDNPLVPLTTMPLGETVGSTPAQAVMTAFAVVAEYARLLVWPVRLSPDYSYDQLPLVTTPMDPRFLSGAAIVVACVVGIVILRKRDPLAAFGLAFLALTFSIVSNVVITIGTICAERLMYLPSAGACIAFGSAAAWMAGASPGRRRIVAGALVVLLATGAARTFVRTIDWRTDFRLWSAAIEVAPRSARVQSEYGRVLMARAQDEAQEGRNDEAERLYASAQSHLETSLRIFPSYAIPMDALATILSLHQRYDEALVLYERAVKVLPANYTSLTNWGGLLWDRALRDSTRAVTLREQGDPSGADALARQAETDFRQAGDKIDQALAIRPSYAHAHLIRALLLEGYAQDRTGAISEFETVLRLAPSHPQRALIERELARLRSPEPVAAPGS